MVARHRLVIAGGLGSGKSTVGSTLVKLGWDVIDTDQIGHDILRDERIVARVSHRWPQVVADGVVDRPALAQIVFKQPQELSILESIIHPEVATRVNSWFSSAHSRAAVEISVLKVVSPEWGRVVVVSAPVGIRIDRAVARGRDREDVMSRIERQLTDAEFLDRAELVIDNSGSRVLLIGAVRELDRWVR